MKSGFMLLELLIATFIAALMCGLLFTALSQSNRLVPKVDNVIDIYSQAAILNTQLERDLSGVCVPLEYFERESKKEAEAAEKKQKEQAAAASKGQPQKNEKPPEEQKPAKPFEKLFYSVNQQDHLALITFITNNPLQVYWSEKAGSAKPRVARVVYRLKEEKPKKASSKKSYQLVRQESSQLEFEAFEKSEAIREYTLATGIKSCAIEFQSWTESVSDKKEEKKKREIKKAREWNSDTLKEKSEKKEEKEKYPLLPQIITLDVVFWDDQKKREQPFSFVVYRRTIMKEPKQQPAANRMVEKVKSISSQLLSPLSASSAAPGVR